MHRIRAVLMYRRDESGREISGDILDVNLFPSDSFPKSGQSIGCLALTHLENSTALEVNHDGFVHMSFSDGKLVYAYAIDSLKGGRSIMIFKMMSVNRLDCVPRHTQEMGCVFECHPLQKINHIPCKATSVTVTADGKRYPFLAIIVTIRTLTLVTADFRSQNYFFAANRKANKVTNAKTILHQMGMTALGTAFRSSFTLDM